MYVNKWTTFAFSVVAQNNAGGLMWRVPIGNIVSQCGMASAGLAYVFSVYSDQIKQRFGLHQSQVLQCTTAAVLSACRAPPLTLCTCRWKPWPQPATLVGT